MPYSGPVVSNVGVTTSTVMVERIVKGIPDYNGPVSSNEGYIPSQGSPLVNQLPGVISNPPEDSGKYMVNSGQMSQGQLNPGQMSQGQMGNIPSQDQGIQLGGVPPSYYGESR